MAGPSLLGIVNPKLLEWARTACALDIPAAAHKIGVKPEKVAAWEKGTAAPSIAQLRKLADVYRRAVSFFFLNEKPRAAKAPTDFRRFEVRRAERSTPELLNAIREAQAKRDAALEIFKDMEDTPPEFDLTLRSEGDPERAAAKLVDQLGITLSERANWNDYRALRAWKAAAEAHGVLVMQVSRIPLDEMRGCSLAMFPLPVILLNSTDSVLGRVFTLLHELTHLARHESALCDTEESTRQGDVESTEAFCNHVAGAMLIPQEALLAEPLVQSANRRTEWSNDFLKRMRNRFRASREVVLRRLLILGKTSRESYRKKREEFQDEYALLRSEQDGGFVPFPRKVVLGNGRLLTGLVLDAYDSRMITGSELSRILGTKLDHLTAIVSEMRGPDIA
ncbi:MAG: ImmA/IrrE family metallo-endopeptidase [Proteobacteria bacterium]|nr:ImmA/IrrE family metallo-endopeptidase [Pseudomonadota bacterium]